MENNNTSVPVGITSIIGWLGAFLALVPTIIKAVEEGQVALAGPEKYLAIAGIVLGAITNIGRYLQAHKMINSGTSEALEGLLDTTGLNAPSNAGVPHDNSVLAAHTPAVETSITPGV